MERITNILYHPRTAIICWFVYWIFVFSLLFASLGCQTVKDAADKFQPKVCAYVKGYGKVCVSWVNGKFVLEAETFIPEEKASEVLDQILK